MQKMKDTFPYMPLMAFAMTGFICIMTETIPAGLLPEISKGMNISLASAGQWDTAGALTRRSAGNLAWALSWLAPDVRYYVSTFAVTNDMDPYQRSGLCGAAKTSKNTVQESTGDPRGQAGPRGRTDLDACTQYPLHLYRTVFVIIRYGGPC